MDTLINPFTKDRKVFNFLLKTTFMKYYQLFTTLEFFIVCVYLFMQQDSHETYLYVIYGVSLLNLIIMLLITSILGLKQAFINSEKQYLD